MVASRYANALHEIGVAPLASRLRNVTPVRRKSDPQQFPALPRIYGWRRNGQHNETLLSKPPSSKPRTKRGLFLPAEGRSEQAHLQPLQDRAGAVAHAKLREDAGDVVLDRALGHPEGV